MTVERRLANLERRTAHVTTVQEPLVMPHSFIEYLPRISPPSWSFNVPHICLIAEHLDAMKRGEIDRLAIFLPPRHSKSETVTVRFPVYLLEDDPTERCLITGYNETIARRFNRKARNIAAMRGLVSDNKAGADEWETPQGGGIVARGVGTPPTGYGFGWIFIDDPIKKREEAESEVYRSKVWDWYTDDLYTRLEPAGKIVLTLTRWHYDDLAARAIASEPDRWTVIKLPALAEADDPLGREIGEALWPERFNEEELERIRQVQTKKDGAYSFESLYQQHPTPREGAFFKVAQMEIVDAVPSPLRIVRAWDLAASSSKGDYTAGVKMGKDAAGNYYVLDVKRERLLPDMRNKLMRQTAELDGRAVRIRITQDPGQAGVDQRNTLIKLMSGFAVTTERPTGKKEVRADPLAAQLNAGNVKLLRGAWNQSYIEELRQFPMGAHDDVVDASAVAFNTLTLTPTRGGGVAGGERRDVRAMIGEWT